VIAPGVIDGGNIKNWRARVGCEREPFRYPAFLGALYKIKLNSRGDHICPSVCPSVA
jgi:hypothetical protein